jgi:hypothetical protein
MAVVGFPRRPAPALRIATVTCSRDGWAHVREDDDALIDDDGRLVNVIVPAALVGLAPGDRVALYRYPQGWVAVGVMR